MLTVQNMQNMHAVVNWDKEFAMIKCEAKKNKVSILPTPQKNFVPSANFRRQKREKGRKKQEKRREGKEKRRETRKEESEREEGD